jgi:hypothetical protein
MNQYTVKFFAKCPANGVRVEYLLVVSTKQIIKVEVLIEITSCYDGWYHEDIADNLLERFGGEQKLSAMHHGVFIETTRKLKP